MAIYRTVQLSFWTDEKVMDEFTPEDKYFYLYLFTNPQTNLCGCYELGWTQTTTQLGYSRDSIRHLLERFEKVHNVIRYSKETKEILLLNWGKHNWQGGKQIPCIEKEINNIKDDYLRSLVIELFEKKMNEGMPLASPLQANCLQATVTVTDTVNNTVSSSFSLSITNIVNYLNKVLGTNYKSNTKNTVKHITARLREGYTEQDFFTVIDKKYAEWHGTDMEKYLVPETLFGTKFEKYLNQNIVVGKKERTQEDLLAELFSVPNETEEQT